jgi:hypothetical protein
VTLDILDPLDPLVTPVIQVQKGKQVLHLILVRQDLPDLQVIPVIQEPKDKQVLLLIQGQQELQVSKERRGLKEKPDLPDLLVLLEN